MTVLPTAVGGQLDYTDLERVLSARVAELEAKLLTNEEIAALRLELMPRMLVASVVASNPAAARAIYKICPGALPWRARWEIENQAGPYCPAAH